MPKAAPIEPSQTRAVAPGRSILNPSLVETMLTFGSAPRETVQPNVQAATTTKILVERPMRVPRRLRLGSFLGVTLLLILLPSCSSPPAALRADVEAYLRRVNDWAPTEAETGRTIDRILATQFVDDAEVRRQVTADAPRARQQVERLSAYQPRTPDVRGIHERYLEAWRNLVTGYANIEAGIDAADAAKLSAGRRALEQWRSAVVATASSLRDLLQRTGATVPAQR